MYIKYNLNKSNREPHRKSQEHHSILASKRQTKIFRQFTNIVLYCYFVLLLLFL